MASGQSWKGAASEMEEPQKCAWRSESGTCDREADCTILDQKDNPVISLCEEHYKVWFARMHGEYLDNDEEEA
jgi:hypothetical protein